MRPTFQDAIVLVQRVYSRHPAGCCLHVVTDDANCEQEMVDACLKKAIELGHDDCQQAGKAIAGMTLTQRHKLCASYGYYCDGSPFST
jgi:hypothetical protein